MLAITEKAAEAPQPFQGTAFTAELIDSGMLNPSEVDPARLADGILHVTARQDAERQDLFAPDNGPDNGRMYLNTKLGAVPLQPGTLVTMWSPSPRSGGYNIPTQHYIDDDRQLRDIQQSRGVPILPPEVARRRQALRQEVATIGDELFGTPHTAFNAVTDTMPAAPTRLHPSEVATAAGAVLDGELVHRPPLAWTMPKHVPTRPDMTFDTLDQAQLNGKLREEERQKAEKQRVQNASDVLADVERIIDDAADDLTRELSLEEIRQATLAAGAPARSRAERRRDEERGKLRHAWETVAALGSAVIGRVTGRANAKAAHHKPAPGRHHIGAVQAQAPMPERTHVR